ncbi:MAG: hypothetical protein AYK18_07875 [Theionarchaea archaeon DG-70]|nr:MAG: hypothetical protein AYK18_07875 [Theionarchaea archaeon DG-70]
MGEEIRFYTYEENFYYFLEEDNNTKEDINNKDNLKIQNCLSLGNSERINPKCEVEENGLTVMMKDCRSL